jgi:heme-degrading monooxygenase HmoA
MIAVIFTARTEKLDTEYEKTVSRLRELAFDKYGCLDFISAAQGDREIAISYWESEDAVRRWKLDAARYWKSYANTGPASRDQGTAQESRKSAMNFIGHV